MIRVAALLLVIEGLFTVIWLAGLLPVLAAHDVTVIALLGARGLTAAALFMGGWLLFNDQPAAIPIARAALLASAVLTTLETGFRLAPSNLDPAYSWATVALYWIYAGGLWWYLGRDTRPS